MLRFDANAKAGMSVSREALVQTFHLYGLSDPLQNLSTGVAT
jgi:hypothetical protein